MFISREKEVCWSCEIPFMRATRSYWEESWEVRVKTSEKSWESEEVILAGIRGFECRGV